LTILWKIVNRMTPAISAPARRLPGKNPSYLPQYRAELAWTTDQPHPVPDASLSSRAQNLVSAVSEQNMARMACEAPVNKRCHKCSSTSGLYKVHLAMPERSARPSEGGSNYLRLVKRKGSPLAMNLCRRCACGDQATARNQKLRRDQVWTRRLQLSEDGMQFDTVGVPRMHSVYLYPAHRGSAPQAFEAPPPASSARVHQAEIELNQCGFEIGPYTARSTQLAEHS
jgi:hypothetical protein